MKQLTAETPFRPLDIGVDRVWGFIIEGAGSSTLQIRIGGEWVDVEEFDDAGTHVWELRRDATYRFSAIGADAIYIF